MKQGVKEDWIAFLEGLILVAVGFAIVAMIVA
jgi:hypothetical protein